MLNKLKNIALLHFIFSLIGVGLLVGCYRASQISNKKGKITAIINPVLNQDFPDPTIINANGKYYAYATNTEVNGITINIQVATSPDLKTWQMLGDAMPQKTTWANQDFWAPHVLYDPSLNKYVLFYSGESNETTTGKCLGVAFADHPQGPFIDKGSPLLCGEGFENIDPMAMQDPKTKRNLLYWGSAHKPIKVQELTADWTSFKPGTTSKAVLLPNQEKNYDRLIEGAWVDYHNNTYYLYYSGDNCCGSKANYAVLVARSQNPLGPFERLGESSPTGSSVILEKDSAWLAPGHNSIVQDNRGQKYIAYHAIRRKVNTTQPTSSDYGARVFCIKPIRYKNGWPLISSNTH